MDPAHANGVGSGGSDGVELKEGLLLGDQEKKADIELGTKMNDEDQPNSWQCPFRGDGAPKQIRIPTNTRPIGERFQLDSDGLPALSDDVLKCRHPTWKRICAWDSRSWGSLTQLTPQVREYYKALRAQIEMFSLADGYAEEEETETQEPNVACIIYGSFGANLLIFIAKVAAANLSGSLVIYASALDSFLDLVSGSILSITACYMASPNRYEFPVGKKRMEGIGVICFAAVMATSYFQVIVEAASRLTAREEINLDTFLIVLLISVVAVKAILYTICQGALKVMTRKSTSLEAQAQDHFNDCVTNLFSAIGTFLASALFAHDILGLDRTALAWVDPVVAILFSIYVILTWGSVALESIFALVGRAAPVAFMQTVTYLAVVHCSDIQAIEKVIAYSHGAQNIVEVDIVLPPEMSVRRSHAIAQTLQGRIENLDDTDRCFVHIDHEVDHTVTAEHKDE